MTDSCWLGTYMSMSETPRVNRCRLSGGIPERWNVQELAIEAIKLERELSAAQAELASYKQIIADLTDDAECLPTCDSHGHDKDCPVMNAANLCKALRGELEKMLKSYALERKYADRWRELRSMFCMEQKFEDEAAMREEDV